jgi:glycosyltransferase involved in cell wall biosynthesis
MTERPFRILILGDPLANMRRWMSGLASVPGVEVHNWHFEGGGRLRRVMQWLRALFTIRGTVRRIAPDVVIGYRVTSYGFLAAWSGHRPLVVAAQGITDVWPPGHWTTPFKAALARFALTRADLIHAWGEHMTTSLREHGAPPERLFVMPTGVDTDAFSPAGQRREPGSAAPLRVCVTRGLFPEYGHDAILGAVRRLRDEGLRIEVFVAGTGPLAGELRAQVDSNQLTDAVFLLGSLAYDELPGLLRKCDVYLSMPETEGVSASLLEAMSAGCFPIVTDIPANRAVIEHRRNGLLLPVGDVTALTDALRWAIAEPASLTAAADSNRAYVVEHANLGRNMRRFVAAYRTLQAGREP